VSQEIVGQGTLPRALFAGFAVSAIGGPLALVTVVGPDAVGAGALRSIGLVILLGALLFGAPVAVWCFYLRRSATDGGLFAFTEIAAGHRVAMVQGGVWLVSYVLYLVYTVTQVVYDLLAPSFPALTQHRGQLLVLLPLLMVAGLLLAERLMFVLLAISAVAQAGLLLILTWVVWQGAGVHASSFAPHGHSGTLARGVANTALLFTCSSLPLFLAGSVVGGAITARRTLIGSVAGVAVLIAAAAFSLSALASSQLATLGFPGRTVAELYSGSTLADAVAIVAVASVLGIVVAEFIAITRVGNAMFHVPVKRVAQIVAVIFVAGDVISLVNPDKVYDDMITPSLTALYISQAIVFASYPLLLRKEGTRRPFQVALAVVATGLMLFGLEVAISQQPYF